MNGRLRQGDRTSSSSLLTGKLICRPETGKGTHFFLGCGLSEAVVQWRAYQLTFCYKPKKAKVFKTRTMKLATALVSLQQARDTFIPYTTLERKGVDIHSQLCISRSWEAKIQGHFVTSLALTLRCTGNTETSLLLALLPSTDDGIEDSIFLWESHT